jgi:exoribonuclease-2
MERYWCLRWLAQGAVRQVDAVVLKDEVLKLVEVPLVIPMPGVKHPRGTQVRLELISCDELDLTVQARVLEISVISDAATEAMDEESELVDQTGISESTEVSGEITAIEVIEATDASEAEASKISTPSNPE